MRAGGALLSLLTAGCARDAAPSFAWFGAYFPAWLLCALFGVAVALAFRLGMTAAGRAEALPYPLAVATAVGVIAGVTFWLFNFG